MNAQLRHVGVLATLLIAVLIGATTYWQSWAGGELANKQGNAVQNVVQLEIDKGSILAANGTRLAWSVPHKKGGLTTYSRKYTPNGAFAQVVTGLDQSLANDLSGTNTNLSNTLSQEIDRLGGQTVHGNNVTLTLKPGLQNLAEHLLAGRCGAVVALNPKTGAIYALASSPTFNPNWLLQRNGQAKINKIKGTCGNGFAEGNRATQGLYPPGSTFKLVTASAALNIGKFTPSSPFYDPGYCVEYGQHISNAGAPDGGGSEVFGNTTLAQGLAHSINSVFCKIGMALGAGTLIDYTKRYGFFSPPPLELPANTLRPSGLYDKGKLTDNASKADPGRMGFGQWKLLATPLQMALVASAIGEHGTEPKPYLVQKVTAPGGSVVSSTTPTAMGHPITPKTAAEITQMMQGVVQYGTAAGVGFPSTLDVAGKTGTAELGLNAPIYDSWFVCFAPASHPKIAIAVIVEKQVNGFGATYAAPVAKSILENFLHG